MTDKKSTSIMEAERYPQDWFKTRYVFDVYPGCSHDILTSSDNNCISVRSIDEQALFTEESIRQFKKEMKRKRKPSLLGMGHIWDPYHPVEKDHRLSRTYLEIIKEYGFAVHIQTRSNLLIEDIKLLKRINENAFVNVTVPMSSLNEKIAQILEPGAPSPLLRLEMIEFLKNAGIYCGIRLEPVFPFINDDWEGIQVLMKEAKKKGIDYIVPTFGVSLREFEKSAMLVRLEQSFPGLTKTYSKHFSSGGYLKSMDIHLAGKFALLAKQLDIVTIMEDLKGYERNDKENLLSLIE